MTLCSKAQKRFKRLPKRVRDYFFQLDKRCQSYRIKLVLGSGESVNFGGGRCGGYFDDANRVLKVAIGGSVESLLSVAIHESAHMTKQWQNPRSIWQDYKIYNGYNRFFRYISGERIYNKTQAIHSAISLEKECEQFAIKEIKRKWLDYINLEKYIANSNAYLFSYLHMAEKRKWPAKTPCEGKFRAHCPTKLLKSYKKIPERLKLAFDRWL